MIAWESTRVPFMRTITHEPDDLLITSNSFEPRCLFAAGTGAAEEYHAKEALLIEYESTSASHVGPKERHRRKLLDALARITYGVPPQRVLTSKYAPVNFVEDIGVKLPAGDMRTVTVDISTLTKCTLLPLISLLLERWPEAVYRFIWTPGVYGAELQLTRGVERTFVVPGFGGVGWGKCRVLIVFLGQERDRTFALWRAVDPDLIFLIAGESEYSQATSSQLFDSVSQLRSFCRCKRRVVSATEPSANREVLREILSEIRSRDYDGDVAVACLGTKVQVLGLWDFFYSLELRAATWNYVYAVPSEFVGRPVAGEYYRELCEINMRL